jgi:hypothetical protein
MEPTNNDPEFLTVDPHGQSKSGDVTKYNPWRAPGKAPVGDPCGIASGSLNPHDYDAVPQGYSAGQLGSAVLPEQEPTSWKAGGTATVGWALSAQHAGGYSYRLCPKDSTLSEECFQNNVLTFATGNTTIHFEDGSQPDKQILTRTYVAPDGAQWRTNPIPACSYDAIHGTPTPNCPTGTKFEAGFDEFTQGFLVGDKNHFSMMDEINVPNTPGEYVLSWRWDCEAADQVWTSCADIVINADPVPAPSPVPAPADATCPDFTPGVDQCSTKGCASRDENGDCRECCSGCWWIYNVHGSTCNGGSKPSPTPTPSPSPTPKDQCASRHPEKQYDCYYEGCTAGDMKSGACTACCDGCHLEHDTIKGDYCMEDKTEFV